MKKINKINNKCKPIKGFNGVSSCVHLKDIDNLIPRKLNGRIESIAFSNKFLNKATIKKLYNQLKPFTIPIWHKDGIADGIKIYKNGKLAKTKGLYESITIIFE